MQHVVVVPNSIVVVLALHHQDLDQCVWLSLLLQVSQFDLYDDFKLFYNVPGNRHKVYKRSNTSEYVEGHSIMLIGYHLDATDPSKDYWVAQNSW